jgi:hypothetical protein
MVSQDIIGELEFEGGKYMWAKNPGVEVDFEEESNSDHGVNIPYYISDLPTTQMVRNQLSRTGVRNRRLKS